MKVQPEVKAETKRIAMGVLVLTALMIAVFLIVGKFDYTVLLGAALGSAAAIGNFFLMALTVQHAADSMPVLPPQSEKEQDGEDGEDKPEKPLSAEARQAGRKMQASYLLRMLGMAGVAIMGAALPVFHPVATLLPMLFPNAVIILLRKFQNPRKEA